MIDKLVTVATYGQTFEAELAQNLLAREGIQAVLNGDPAMCALFGAAGSAILLQVPEEAAQRAAGILSAYAADAALDRDWEEQAESGQDVWVCSICGEAISNRLSVCYSCTTPREGIRTTRPAAATDVQTSPSTDAPSSLMRPAPLSPRHEEAELEPPSSTDGTARIDDLARRALIASLFGIVLAGLLLPLAWYYIVRLRYTSGELSPVGQRRYFWAVLLSEVGSLIWFLLYSLPQLR